MPPVGGIFPRLRSLLRTFEASPIGLAIAATSVLQRSGSCSLGATRPFAFACLLHLYRVASERPVSLAILLSGWFSGGIIFTLTSRAIPN